MSWIRKNAHYLFLLMAFVGFFIFKENPLHFKYYKGLGGSGRSLGFSITLDSMVFTAALFVSLAYWWIIRFERGINDRWEYIHLFASMSLGSVIILMLAINPKGQEGVSLWQEQLRIGFEILFLLFQVLFVVNLFIFGRRGSSGYTDILDLP